MKLKIFSILFLFFIVFSTLVSADIISVNSGGDTGLIINPDNYIEAFFMGANRFPVVANVLLVSSLGTNTTYENLSVSFSASDADDNTITNITDWRVDGDSICVLNMAFDKRVYTLNSGDVKDYSTNLNSGTLGGGTSSYSPTWISNGQIGGAYEFDGSNDYISLTSLDNFVSSVGSISYWIKLNDKDDPSGIYHFYETAYTDYIRSYIDSNNKMDLVIEDGNSAKINVNYDLDNLGDYVGDWIHVVWTQNGTAVQLYINGDEKSLSGTNSGSWWTSHLSFSVGNLGYAWAYLNGSLDEFQVYNRSLSAQQINALYNAGNIGNHSKLLVSQETQKGETWQVAVTPNDVFDDGLTVLSNNLTIVDSSPDDPTSVTLLSLNARNESDTNLNCSAFVSDADNDELTVYVNWIKDDISQYNYSFASQTNGTTFSTTLDNNNLTLADVWKCSVRTYDSNSYSNWVDSNELTITDITAPNITILSPNSSINYAVLEVDFNITIQENENISVCMYSLNQTANITMIEINDSFFWYEPTNLIPGTHNVTFYCNDTSGNWGVNSTNFTILDEAAIAISLSPSLAWNVNWTLASLPADDLNASGNNGDDTTEYYVNISTENVNVDLYVKADGNLTTGDLDILVLGNETYVVNVTNSSVPDLNRLTMTTNYYLIGQNLANASVVYMKFYLDAPAAQPAGVYLNNLDFKAVKGGTLP